VKLRLSPIHSPYPHQGQTPLNRRSMVLQVFLNATLRRYVPGYNPHQGISLEVAVGITVAGVLAQLGLPAHEVTLIMVNGRRQEADWVLQGGERLGLFPPIGGG
jgi:sulfur-carrier protein